MSSDTARANGRSHRGHATVRIGGACGFWGDSMIATPQLLDVPRLDYLVYDYLAETTMSILARAQAKNPALGYATDFVNDVLQPHLARILAQGVRVIANAGGLNPLACRDAIAAIAQQQNLNVRIAVVTGDSLLPAWQAGKLTSVHSIGGMDGINGNPVLPESLLSMSAYVGARGIADALDAGAQIVITGRTVDSACVLGALAHEFGWAWNDWDRLAAGTVAGHIIECGAQATGGLFTDWQRVPDWENIGYPVLDVEHDGSFILTKPAGTGGLIDRLAAAEQLLYEIGDPACYRMADVICDVRAVRIEPIDAQHVRVSGARGRAPERDYKGNVTWQDGWQIQLMMAIRGIDAPAKARRTADALLARTRQMLHRAGLPDYSATQIELLGCENLYGPHARALDTREVVLRIAARHPQAAGLKFLQRECASAGTSMAAGTRSTFGGRADIQALIRVRPFLIDRAEVPLALVYEGLTHPVETNIPIEAMQAASVASPSAAPASALADEKPAGRTRRGRLVQIAVARSGDKGDDENIGVIARRPEYLPWLRHALTPEVVHAYFAHLVQGQVTRYEVPGIGALNFVLTRALGGGGVSSLRSDPLGKSYAQMLLDMELDLPQDAFVH
ncbi:MAG: DUF1446 domain-containing protein [Burkholderiaceae bacterium]|jgi:hypothetical protein|nr:DUF1446 domain-containing protein [Burkholderiaceae bacterium]